MVKTTFLLLVFCTADLLWLQVADAKVNLSKPFLKRLRKTLTPADNSNLLLPMSGSGSDSSLDICAHDTLQDIYERMRDIAIKCQTRTVFENCCQVKFFALRSSSAVLSSPSVYPVTLHKRLQLAYCDMTTAGGGWMIVYSGGNNYFRNQGLERWSVFRLFEFGYGKFQRDFWLGLAHLHHYTRNGAELLVELVKNGTTYFAHYNRFSVGRKSQGYKLHVGGYRRESTLPDSLSHSNGFNFSLDYTSPAVRKQYPGYSCWYSSLGRWWFGERGNESCTRVSLIRNYNAPGPYGSPGPSKLLWEVNGEKVGFDTGTMKIRPKAWECGNAPLYPDIVLQGAYLSAVYPSLNPFNPDLGTLSNDDD